MKSISFEDLEAREFDSLGIGTRPFISGQCIKCKEPFTYHSVQTFLLNRKKYQNKKPLWNTCGKCWFSLQTHENPEWIKKNSDAQFIAQNKPEQKRRNAIGVSKSWDAARKQSGSDYLKRRWKEDENFKTTALKNLSWTQTNDDKFNRIMRKSLGRGGLKGIYHDIYYDSALELSYIIWCNENHIPIKRYDLEPIEYLDEAGKPRKYFPDFIINDSIIIEIKGYGLYYKINFLRNICKLKAAQKFFTEYNMILSSDECLKKNYLKARKLHHENYKQKNNTI